MRVGSRAIVQVIAVTAVAAAIAGTADASASTLVLRSAGVPVAPGDQVFTSIEWIPTHLAGACVEEQHAEDLTNGMATDSIAAGAVFFLGCGGGPLLTGGQVKEVRVSVKGKLTFKLHPKAAIQLPGPCVYEMAKATVKFKLGFPLGVWAGTLTAKLNAKASLPGCSASEPFEVEENVFSGFGASLATELVP